MVLRVRDIVDYCYTNDQGQEVFRALKPQLAGGAYVEVSFEGITEATSSFVNSAFVRLLDSMDYETIKSRLSITRSTRQINDLINRSFWHEVTHRHDERV